MKIVNQSHRVIWWDIASCVRSICEGYCICYATKVPESFEEQCAIIKRHRHHESPLEHSILTVEFTTNRGVSHELVRHRHAGYSQQSTRYCNYSKNKFGNELTFIKNSKLIDDEKLYKTWVDNLSNIEKMYFNALEIGEIPEEARGCLPNDLMTKIIVSANLREWRYIFRLRCEKHAHYQMRELMIPLFEEVCKELPCVFDDIEIDY